MDKFFPAVPAAWAVLVVKAARLGWVVLTARVALVVRVVSVAPAG
jgi:hypothetical protein